MYKRIDYTEICEKFNKLRLDNIHKIYQSQEMRNLMQSIGINTHIFRSMANKNFFKKRRNGNVMEYTFPDNPIYKKVFENLYKDYNSSINNNKKPVGDVENSIQLLKSLGYKILKEEGIDEDALQAKYPDIYKELLIVKEI